MSNLKYTTNQWSSIQPNDEIIWFDLETTGLSPSNDGIVEIFALRSKIKKEKRNEIDRRKFRQFGAICCPDEYKLDPEITPGVISLANATKRSNYDAAFKIHQLPIDIIQTEPSEYEVLCKFHKWLSVMHKRGVKTIGGQNICRFDIPFLKERMIITGVFNDDVEADLFFDQFSYLDTLYISNILNQIFQTDGVNKCYKLSDFPAEVLNTAYCKHLLTLPVGSPMPTKLAQLNAIFPYKPAHNNQINKSRLATSRSMQHSAMYDVLVTKHLWDNIFNADITNTATSSTFPLWQIMSFVKFDNTPTHVDYLIPDDGDITACFKIPHALNRIPNVRDIFLKNFKQFLKSTGYFNMLRYYNAIRHPTVKYSNLPCSAQNNIGMLNKIYLFPSSHSFIKGYGLGFSYGEVLNHSLDLRTACSLNPHVTFINNSLYTTTQMAESVLTDMNRAFMKKPYHPITISI